jgi:hypothetical protein
VARTTGGRSGDTYWTALWAGPGALAVGEADHLVDGPRQGRSAASRCRSRTGRRCGPARSRPRP